MFWQNMRAKWQTVDPRIPVAFILFSYLILGLTVLGFNRTPEQILVTCSSTLFFDAVLFRLFYKKWRLSLSALITSFSLCFLLNYSHDFGLQFIPIFFAIGSKFFFQLRGRHFFNPALMGVTCSLLFSQDLVTASPAYQWYGFAAMSAFVVVMAFIFVIPSVHRNWLVISFLTTYTLLLVLRAYIMRHHLPFETLFFGTLSSPPFLIFTFFMITDPRTSPDHRKGQIIVGICIAVLDLLFHLRQSYYTFFYAASTVQVVRFVWFHFQEWRGQGGFRLWYRQFFQSHFYFRGVVLAGFAVSGTWTYQNVIHPHLPLQNLVWTLEQVPVQQSHLIGHHNGGVFEKLDPRVQHIAKWVLSEGDAVAVADIDGDGKPDVFLTNMLKADDEKAALFRNIGDWQFVRVPLPQLDEVIRHPEIHGLITNALFVDFDNSGKQSLFLSVAFGHPILLKNITKAGGPIQFKDVTEEVGLANLYTNSLSASFADFNKDGLLDLLILNVWPENLPDYSSPTRLNLFHLPQSEFAGDERMFNFMHDSWNKSNNGGKNLLFLQNEKHQFVQQDSDEWGLPETRWSLAVGIADLNHDGWPDIYIANDFGPDDLYFNEGGRHFANIKGKIFGSIGKDTYKGMNVSLADFDHTGWLGVYVSNVHHALQAEGSLLWKFSPSSDAFRPEIDDVASQRGALNEDRFGWGAAAVDFDNSGWAGLAQANGMVDDTWDKKFETCPDYWYVNEKVARSPPSIHRYANHWGDLRGFCIYGTEQNRIYLNRGSDQIPQFVDVASEVGVTELTNSRGVAAADFENRGRMDLLFTHPFKAPTLYKNQIKFGKSNDHHWIKFSFESLDPKCNREAIGTSVRLQITKQDGSQWQQSQEVQVVSGFLAQSDKRLHFGLGNEIKSLSAEVSWCNGYHLQVLQDLNVDQIQHLQLEAP